VGCTCRLKNNAKKNRNGKFKQQLLEVAGLQPQSLRMDITAIFVMTLEILSGAINSGNVLHF